MRKTQLTGLNCWCGRGCHFLCSDDLSFLHHRHLSCLLCHAFSGLVTGSTTHQRPSCHGPQLAPWPVWPASPEPHPTQEADPEPAPEAALSVVVGDKPGACKGSRGTASTGSLVVRPVRRAWAHGGGTGAEKDTSCPSPTPKIPKMTLRGPLRVFFRRYLFFRVFYRLKWEKKSGSGTLIGQ